MSPKLSNWKSNGEYIEYGPFKHKLFVLQFGNSSADANKTLLLLHGFPESSFSYHAVITGLLNTFDRIVLFDMLGYGHSDKPEQNYTYSLMEQADTAFVVWNHFNVSGGHLLAHDMGDSVATEILSRHERNLMPNWFSEGLQSLTLTNGSVVLAMSDLRIMQKILISRFGYMLRNLTTYKVFTKQIKSAHGNDKLSEESIQLLWEANALQDGIKKAYLTIRYLTDRKKFEKSRWLPALAQTNLPIHLCWGDDDAVARVEMAYHLKKNVCKDATLTIMKGLGHFCQIGSPDEWVGYVGKFYE